MNKVAYRVSALSQEKAEFNDRETGVHPVDLDQLTHELRQPLSTIESLAYYLELTAVDDHVCRHLEQIRHMVTRANYILEHASLS